MFITKEQLEKRLNSSRNVLNIIRPADNPLTPGDISVPDQKTVPVEENLPNETDKQRAARHARFHIDRYEKHEEYTVNPNIGNDILRSTIGILAEDPLVSSQQIQKEFGLTKNQIIGAKNSKKKSIQDRIERGRNRVSELAIDRLMETLGLLDPSLICDEKPKDIAAIAAHLAKVASSMRNENKDLNEGAKANIVIYAPQSRTIDNFSVIDV